MDLMRNIATIFAFYPIILAHQQQILANQKEYGTSGPVILVIGRFPFCMGSTVLCSPPNMI